MEATVFEERVRDALLEATALDWPDTKESGEPLPAPSARYQRWEKKFLSDPFGFAKKQARPMWVRALRAAAGIVLALSVSLGALMAASPNARAWVQQIFVQWFSTSARFTFSGNAGQETGAWKTGYLPEGFELAKVNEMSVMTKFTYRSETGEKITFIYFPAASGSILTDSEHQSYQELTINGNVGILMQALTDDEPSYLIWTDESTETAFEIESTIASEELIKMAESIVSQR